MRLLRQFPAFVVLLMVASAMMLLPAVHAAQLGEWRVARVFLEHAVFFLLFGIILGLATMNRKVRVPPRYFLMTLLFAYMLLPLMLAAPLVALVPAIGLGGAYFEMLSCLTTTGATLFDRPQAVAESIHLWRALVGWMGGLLILVSTFAILAPLNLGGFEIGHAGDDRKGVARSGTVGRGTPSHRPGAAHHRAGLRRDDGGALRAARDLRRHRLRRALPRDGDAVDQRHLAGRRARRGAAPGCRARLPSPSSCCRRCRCAASASFRGGGSGRASPIRRSS